MAALEDLIMEKVRLMSEAQKREVLAFIETILQLQHDDRPVMNAADMINELREERTDEIMRSIGLLDDDESLA